jgi:uncharacterized membrane protein YhaH (DUF805 family)
MRGIVLAIAPDGTYGQLSADDGERYSYWTSEVRNGRAKVGDKVDFQMYGDQPVDIFLMMDRSMPAPAQGARPTMRPRVVGPQQTTSFASSIPPLNYWIKLFTTPNGRIARREFWLFGVLPIVVVNLVFGLIPLINIVVMLGTFWGSICICFKRFHDHGYTGWWCLLNIVPSVLASVMAVASVFGGGKTFGIASILWLVSLAILIAQIVFVYARVGNPGTNKYGPDPLATPAY